MTSRDVFPQITSEKHVDESSRGVSDFMVRRHRQAETSKEAENRVHMYVVGGSRIFLLRFSSFANDRTFFSPFSSRLSRNRVSPVSLSRYLTWVDLSYESLRRIDFADYSINDAATRYIFLSIFYFSLINKFAISPPR